MLGAEYLLRWAPHPPATLLADANVPARTEYSSFLANSGCAVDEVEDGRVALARALTTRVDIVIVEQNLPGLNAARLSEILRADQATRTLPVLVMNADTQNVDGLRTCGADAVVVGRPRPENLAVEMQQLLTRAAQLHLHALAARTMSQQRNATAAALLERSLKRRRPIMSRAHNREYTESPALAPPAVVCPQCDRPLRYEYSHTGGVSEKQAEQWDYFVCSSGCGTFQFRHRTNKLRKV